MPRNDGYYVTPSGKRGFDIVMVVGEIMQAHVLATCQRIENAKLIAKLLNQHEKNWNVRPEDLVI